MRYTVVLWFGDTKTIDVYAHAVQLGPAFLLMSRLDRVTGFVSLLFAHGQRNAIPPERYHSVRVPHSPDSRITVVDAQIDPPACAQKA